MEGEQGRGRAREFGEAQPRGVPRAFLWCVLQLTLTGHCARRRGAAQLPTGRGSVGCPITIGQSSHPCTPCGPPRTASASMATEDGGEASVSDPPLAMFTSVCRDNCANQRDAPAHAPTVTVLTSLIALCHGTAFRTRSTFELSIIFPVPQLDLICHSYSFLLRFWTRLTFS